MKAIIIFILVLFFGTQSFSQVSVFTKISLADGKISPVGTIFGTKPLSEKFGVTYFALVSEGWAETQVGVYYSPASWLQLGLSCGIEQKQTLFRTGGSVWLGKGNTSLLSLVERGVGPDNYWYKVTLNQKVGNFDLGLRGWRYIGFGPVVQYKIGKTGLKIWTMPAFGWFESKTNSVLFGIDYAIK